MGSGLRPCRHRPGRSVAGCRWPARPGSRGGPCRLGHLFGSGRMPRPSLSPERRGLADALDCVGLAVSGSLGLDHDSAGFRRGSSRWAGRAGRGRHASSPLFDPPLWRSPGYPPPGYPLSCLWCCFFLDNTMGWTRRALAIHQLSPNCTEPRSLAANSGGCHQACRDFMHPFPRRQQGRRGHTVETE